MTKEEYLDLKKGDVVVYKGYVNRALEGRSLLVVGRNPSKRRLCGIEMVAYGGMYHKVTDDFKYFEKR